VLISSEPIVKLIQAAKDFEQAATSDKVEVRMLIIQPHSPTTPTWMLFNHLSPRPLATVALDQDKMTDLIKDFNDSLKPEKAVYNKLRGIPYKRVYLFHGPPGTGKSSTILALAGFFGLPLYFLSLNAEGLDDGTLQMAIKWVPTRCIIAIEEIDTARLSRKKGSQDLPGPTLGAVLSVLDGIATSPGRIFILTSNKPGDLDEALVRPGRTDYKLEFTKSNSQMSEELFKNIYHTVIDESSLNSMAMRFGEVTPDGKYSAADIQALLLKYEDDPEKAIEGMMEQVKRDRLHCDNFPPLLKTPVSQLPNDEFDPGTRRSSF
jgi:chaperone BCS1